MDFGGQKQKPEQQFREELRILATQIETINQQLASGTGGSGPALGKSFSDVNSKMSFLYEFMKSMQNDLHEETKTSMEQVGVTVNNTLQKNLGDIFAALQDIQKSLHNTKTSGDGAADQDVQDIKSTLKELISVYREEVAVFKAQNDFLQRKLVDIEKRLNSLDK